MYVEFEVVMWANTFLCTFCIALFLVSLQLDELQHSDEQTWLQWASLFSFLIRMKDCNINISVSSLMFWKYINSCVYQMLFFSLIYLRV